MRSFPSLSDHLFALMETEWLPDCLALVPDLTSREKCIARLQLQAGITLLSDSAYVTTLLGSEKGQRCDFCLSIPATLNALKRCTGCGSYWYCSEICQNAQWKIHHKRICKTYNSFISSLEYQSVPSYQKSDAILLSHLVSRLSLLPVPYSVQESGSDSLLISLLPCPGNSSPPPPICSIRPAPPRELVSQLHDRFGNNHFAIHSHLNTIGHGIFPKASRTFNHSCLPNAVAKYIFSPYNPVRIEIIALRDIAKDEEICLPYLDPALLETREQMLEFSYGFQCQCLTSSFLRKVGALPSAPITTNEVARVSKELREFVGYGSAVDLTVKTLKHVKMDKLPTSLYCVLREAFITTISETFSKASHEGTYDAALESGMTLLSLYLLVYPPNYPQIGMHLLELAKTTWNAVIFSADQTHERELRERARVFLTHARCILDVMGSEGDSDGPRHEIVVLDNLLQKKSAGA